MLHLHAINFLHVCTYFCVNNINIIVVNKYFNFKVYQEINWIKGWFLLSGFSPNINFIWHYLGITHNYRNKKTCSKIPIWIHPHSPSGVASGQQRCSIFGKSFRCHRTVILRLTVNTQNITSAHRVCSKAINPRGKNGCASVIKLLKGLLFFRRKPLIFPSR